MKQLIIELQPKELQSIYGGDYAWVIIEGKLVYMEIGTKKS